MSNTTYNDFAPPAVNAAWLNDANRLVYLLAGDGTNAPANTSDVRNNLGVTLAIANGDAATLAAANTAATNLPGRLINVQKFGTVGTFVYTPTAGTTRVVVELWGAGGGGAGAILCPASQCSAGTGGGAGGYARHLATSGFSGVNVVVGAVGAAGTAGGAGGVGGSSSFGALVTATGGNGGTPTTAGTIIALAGAIGGLGNGNIVGTRGQQGGSCIMAFAQSIWAGGSGGSANIGSGGMQAWATAGAGQDGFAADGYASGGAGGANGNAGLTRNGGVGTQGLVLVYEYS